MSFFLFVKSTTKEIYLSTFIISHFSINFKGKYLCITSLCLKFKVHNKTCLMQTMESTCLFPFIYWIWMNLLQYICRMESWSNKSIICIKLNLEKKVGLTSLSKLSCFRLINSNNYKQIVQPYWLKQYIEYFNI